MVEDWNWSGGLADGPGEDLRGGAEAEGLVRPIVEPVGNLADTLAVEAPQALAFGAELDKSRLACSFSPRFQEWNGRAKYMSASSAAPNSPWQASSLP